MVFHIRLLYDKMEAFTKKGCLNWWSIVSTSSSGKGIKGQQLPVCCTAECKCCLEERDRLLAQICALLGWDCFLTWLLCVFSVFCLSINYCQSISEACRGFWIWEFLFSCCLWRWCWTMSGRVSQQDSSKENQ